MKISIVGTLVLAMCAVLQRMTKEQRYGVPENTLSPQLAWDYAGKVGLSGKNRPGSPCVLRYKLRIVRICPQCMARCTDWR